MYIGILREDRIAPKWQKKPLQKKEKEFWSAPFLYRRVSYLLLVFQNFFAINNRVYAHRLKSPPTVGLF